MALVEKSDSRSRTKATAGSRWCDSLAAKSRFRSASYQRSMSYCVGCALTGSGSAQIARQRPSVVTARRRGWLRDQGGMRSE